MEIKYLEVVVMDNGEIICMGKTVGWTDKLGKFLSSSEPIEIEIEGGVLTEVRGLPKGMTYKLIDRDNEK